MQTTQELAGKVAIVTGAGRNIGRAIAIDLAAAGAAVVVNARANRTEAGNVVGVIEQAGGRAAVCLGDVGEPATAAALVALAIERFGRLDILVNNAAVRREQPFASMTYEQWREITRLILDGPFHLAKAALPHLQRAGGGTIVHLGGVSSNTGARDRAHVITGKAGLTGLTRALAHDLAADNITVNCVSPGMIDTTRVHGPVPGHHQGHQTLAGRKGTSEEIASMVRYLCGPNARFITGQTIQVNGGAYMG
jgi:3-oxoacyl-[acyl-carrier protein] reductase